MNEPVWENCTEEQVWEYVGWHLAKNRIETVLVGGAVAAIYSEGIYKSGDLDLVLKTYVVGELSEIMNSIGFYSSSGRTCCAQVPFQSCQSGSLVCLRGCS